MQADRVLTVDVVLPCNKGERSRVPHPELWIGEFSARQKDTVRSVDGCTIVLDYRLCPNLWKRTSQLLEET
jgi:hypothetical protein